MNIPAIVFPLVFLLVGLIVWSRSKDGKTSEIGRLTFFCGLFWLVWLLSGHALKI